MDVLDEVPVLTDGTVTLRALAEDDIEAVAAQANDPLTRQFTDVPIPVTTDDVRRLLQDARRGWGDGSASTFAVESAFGVGARRFAGTVCLRDRGNGMAAIAYTAHPEVRGRGVTTRAVNVLLDWAFDRGVRSIVWESPSGNIAGCRVAWKTGFTFEGMTRATIPQRGDLRDGWRATLLSSDPREPTSCWRRPVTLHDDRVRLRVLGPDDEQRFIETTVDEESMVWLGTFPLPRTPERYAAHLARQGLNWSAGQAVEWAFAAIEDDRYLGTLVLFGLTGIDYLSAEVGYRTHPDSRGQGYLRSALTLALDHAFTPEEDGGLGRNRVALNAGVGNVGSLAVAAGLGFTETGRDRACYDLPDGTVVDLVRFDLLKAEHQARRAR